MKSEEPASLLEFPCRFPIKAMGKRSGEFEELINTIVLGHATLWPGEEFTTSVSSAGTYVSVTAVIEARSQDQLDAIYQELTDHELVLMAL